ncbi:hypothetical protein IFM89_023442 [Coptis chinensis]|uniref:Uncharacterized protein n=1 Tax=Coptis chinensis TaxID=261450 RepID=A0A835IXX7_9MAGN|nr:hypothetical protein IFM89_023442 [Coptis chinensis]
MSPTLVSLSEQQITIQVENYLMSFVHASCSYGVRRQLWQELTMLGQSGQAWAVIGEFNIVTSFVERKGGGTPCISAMDDFNFYPFECSHWLTRLGCKVVRDGGAKFLNATEIDEVTNVMTTIAKEKSRVSDALHGERNSAYFHATIRMRQLRAQIIEIKNREGVLLKQHDQIKGFIVEEY